MRRRHARALGFIGLMSVLLATLITSGHARISTDIFDLLPEAHRDMLANMAMDQSRRSFFNEVTAVLVAPDRQRGQLVGAVAVLRKSLSDAPLAIRHPGSQASLLQSAYLENRFEWLTPQDRIALQTDSLEALRLNLAVNLARPGNFNTADPAGFTAHFIAGLPAPGKDWTLLDGIPARNINGDIFVVLNTRLASSPLQPDVQTSVANAFASARNQVAAVCGDCRLHWTGAIRYSQATRLAAERDITLLSTVASLGILLLFVFMFRALRPLALATGTLLAAVLAGLTIGFVVFGELHVLTLVFGTTLLGLCIDYVLHFTVHRWAHAAETADESMHAVRTGLLLGLATSVTAFLFLLLAGFPALSQLAVFSISGLLTTWILVNLLRDVIAPGHADNVVSRLATAGFALPTRARLALLAIIAVAALFGSTQVRVVDDVRGLQYASAEIIEDNQVIRDVTRGLPGDTGSAVFHLVRAPDLETALQREGRLFAALDDNSAFGLSRFILPRSVRKENIASHAPLFAHEGRELRELLAAFGFKQGMADALISSYEKDAASIPGSSSLLEASAFASLRPLYVFDGKAAALVARLPEDAAIPPDMPWVQAVNPLAEVEATFSAIRMRGTYAVAAAWLLMLGALSSRYGLRGGLRVLAPAVFGAGTALGLLGLAGLPLNIFSLVALILVLGIGADYALFLREANANLPSARIATAMAAATSLLSFGLLTFSSLPALQAFGFTVGTGVVAAFLAAPLAVRFEFRHQNNQRQENLDRAA